MQTKTTRAFRTISEAAEELDLQPHVLRFWESKFSQIRPIKRAGGRRLYRPEDIDLLRGIKILLHEEKHPIKDVQKIIRLKGPNQVVELGRSIKQAARPRDITDTVLIPERIKDKPKREDVRPINAPAAGDAPASPPAAQQPVATPDNIVAIPTQPIRPVASTPAPVSAPIPQPVLPVAPALDKEKLKSILSRLKELRGEWDAITLKPVE